MEEEVEFAVKYAEERRKRIELEKRLLGMIFHVFPYSRQSIGLVQAMTEKKQKEMAQRASKILHWHAGVELSIAYNLLFPVGDMLPCMEGFNPREADGIDEIPSERMDALAEATKAAAKLVEADWMAEGLRSEEDMTRDLITQAAKTIAKSMRDEKEHVSH